MTISTYGVTVLASGRVTKGFDVGTGSVPVSVGGKQNYSEGTGASQINALYADTRTLGPSANEDFDLAGGNVPDFFGDAQTFLTVKGLTITAALGNTNNVLLRRLANGIPLLTASGQNIPIHPGGKFHWEAPGTGITVTPGSADLINIANSAGSTSVEYTILIVGTK